MFAPERGKLKLRSFAPVGENRQVLLETDWTPNQTFHWERKEENSNSEQR
jgi:hypothetical protein